MGKLTKFINQSAHIFDTMKKYDTFWNDID